MNTYHVSCPALEADEDLHPEMRKGRLVPAKSAHGAAKRWLEGVAPIDPWEARSKMHHAVVNVAEDGRSPVGFEIRVLIDYKLELYGPRAVALRDALYQSIEAERDEARRHLLALVRRLKDNEIRVEYREESNDLDEIRAAYAYGMTLLDEE